MVGYAVWPPASAHTEAEARSGEPLSGACRLPADGFTMAWLGPPGMPLDVFAPVHFVTFVPMLSRS